MSSAGAAKSAIHEATRELMVHWHEVRERWRDAKAADFSKEHLSGLGEDAARALRVIDELERLIAKIHADCE